MWYVLLYYPVRESTGCVTFKLHSVSQFVWTTCIWCVDYL